jgi:Fe2+ or Zn2+ uptake regulation protein
MVQASKITRNRLLLFRILIERQKKTVIKNILKSKQNLILILSLKTIISTVTHPVCGDAQPVSASEIEGFF